MIAKAITWKTQNMEQYKINLPVEVLPYIQRLIVKCIAEIYSQSEELQLQIVSRLQLYCQNSKSQTFIDESDIAFLAQRSRSRKSV